MHPLENNEEFKKALTDEKLFFSKDKEGIWWFHEKIHDDLGQSMRVDDFELHTSTNFQMLAVFNNARLGNVLVLDGAVQITENNWHEYQEKLVASTILPLYEDPTQPIEVLIIGGGDGGVATTTRKLFPNANVTMVEIDEGVVDAAKKYFPEISESLRVPNPRFNLIIGDGADFVKKTDRKFDVIIVDCTDPFEGGPAVKLFGTTFHENAKKCLTKNGIILQQSGTLETQVDEVKQTVEMMKALYRYPIVLPVNMLTYQGTMTLVGGSDLNIAKLGKAMLQKRFSDVHKLDGKTRNFKPSTFLESLNNLPPEHQLWLDKMLATSQNQNTGLKSFAGTPHALQRTSQHSQPSEDTATLQAPAPTV